MNRYALYRRLDAPEGRSGWVRNILPPTGIWSPCRPARSEWGEGECFFLLGLGAGFYFGLFNESLRSKYISSYRSFATGVSQFKIWHFWVIGTERNVLRCTFNRYSVVTQFVKLAAGEQLCRRCTYRKLWHFKTFKSFSRKITDFELWHSCPKWAWYGRGIKWSWPKLRYCSCISFKGLRQTAFNFIFKVPCIVTLY